jgi:RimJ/RimL family protein N-acetyltransferase
VTNPEIPELLTPRLRLRGWRADDLVPLAEIAADPRVGEWLGGTRTEEEMERALLAWQLHWEERGHGIWAAEERASGRLIGRIGLMHWEDFDACPEHDAEVGWTLHPSVWGHGLATEGARAALDWGFGERAMRLVISITLPTNRRSQRVMEKLGLTRRGEMSWRGYDQVWYAITGSEWASARPRRGAVIL